MQNPKKKVEKAKRLNQSKEKHSVFLYAETVLLIIEEVLCLGFKSDWNLVWNVWLKIISGVDKQVTQVSFQDKIDGHRQPSKL